MQETTPQTIARRPKPLKVDELARNPKPGLYDIPDPAYRAIDLPSASQCKVLLDGTNAHLAYHREHGREETSALIVGQYLHALVLEPDTINSRFEFCSKADRRTKDGKDAYATALARAQSRGATLLHEPDAQLAEAMFDAVTAKPVAMAVVQRCEMREVTVIGEIDGRLAKARMDGVILDDSGRFATIVDLKTTTCAGLNAFGRSAVTYHYPFQAAFYSRLLRSIGIVDVEDFIFVAVEKERPHLAAIYRCSGVGIEVSDRGIDAIVRRWWAVKEGDRTGYPDEIQELELPRWFINGGGAS